MSTVPPPPENAAQQFTSSRDAKAQAKAAKAYQKANRPWFKKKRFWLLGLVALVIILSIATQGGDDADTASDEPTQSAAQEPTEEATSDDAAAQDEAAAEEAAAEEAAAEEAAAEEAAAEEAAAEEAAAEEAAAEEALVVSARQMIDDLEGNALNAKTTYEGKLVTVTGYVGNIDASGDYFALDPEPDAIIFTGVQVQLDESHIETVSGYTQGQEVTVTGTVTSVGEILGYSVEADTLG